jgi:membrane-bound acyltransferase YfiQ involved in biofilm formation
LGYAWAGYFFLGIYMANISEYDAKIYFWGMVLFATVSFIALPAVAFIYLENRIINEQTKIALKKIEKLEKKLTKEKEE